MSHFPEPSRALCLSCGEVIDFPEEQGARCSECGTELDPKAILRLYEYAAEVYYYGVQYRRYYEDAYAESNNPPKPSLLFDGEAFAWVMLAALSGVVGNAAYDLVKSVANRVREDVAAGRLPARDYSPMLELSDNELGELIGSAREYRNGMDGLTKEVRAAIAEEIVADSVVHNPAVANEMMKLMRHKKVTQKDRKRFSELLRKTLVAQQQRSHLPASAFSGLWSRRAK
ncbi:MAG: hypothetical protein EKK46_06645 [Rhodocyclaceae bacterium]|nr:MAG: hypothetical protein EKK46_06645 [Rhodocyclaceae bacterium]